MASKKVHQICIEIDRIHEKKNKDYAQDDNWASNFERAAVIASWFNDPVDKVFATMIGIKLARMAELLNGKTPNNESLADSFLDQNTYSVLWHAYFLERKLPSQGTNELKQEISKGKHLWKNGRCTKCDLTYADFVVGSGWVVNCDERLLKSPMQQGTTKDGY